MKARIATLIMAALLVLYLAFVTNYAILLITSTEPLAKVMGCALILLPGIGAWVMVADLLFVVRGERLLSKLGGEGGLPVDNLPRLPSGRAEPAAADAEFPTYRAEVEAEPDSWRAWLRLGLAYDASGDRRRARWATRRAIALHRSTGGGASTQANH